MFRYLNNLPIVLVLFFCFMASIGQAQNFEGKRKDIDQILENIAAFSQHVMNSDYDKIAEAYTNDAKIFPGNQEILSGRDRIKKYWVLPEGVRTSYHKIMPEEIKVIKDHAYDYGYYEGKTRRKDGSEVSWKGKYVIVWKKEKGEWKMLLDIWNRL
jgi:ketosteroid isomerase-like protein